MFREKVVITRLTLAQAGQVVNFQVKIPCDALRIIGIEVSSRTLPVGEKQAPPPPPSGQITDAQNVGSGLSGIQSSGSINISINSDVHIERVYRGGGGRETFQFSQDTLLGDLRLQSCEDTNVFYAGDVYSTDVNLGYGDYSVGYFQPLPETHGVKWEECTVNTKGITTIIKGIFRDRQGKSQNNFNPYQVSVYVWYEKKDKAI